LYLGGLQLSSAGTGYNVSLLKRHMVTSSPTDHLLQTHKDHFNTTFIGTPTYLSQSLHLISSRNVSSTNITIIRQQLLKTSV